MTNTVRIGRIAASVTRALVVTVLAFGAPVAALAQSGLGQAPPEARALVVRIAAQFANGGADQGAGIVVGITDSLVYIATARHLVYHGATALTGLTVTFAPPAGETVQATLRFRLEPDQPDIAVISISHSAARGIVAARASLDRLGDPRHLALSPVSPVGCPEGECWQVPVPPDMALGVDRKGINFQSDYVSGGSSGGALFNADWEVVGMVTEVSPPRSNAIPVDELLRQLRTWKVPTQLRKTSIPRAGYATVASGTLLMPMGSGQSFSDSDRLPSGRVSLTRRGRSLLRWHGSVMRLAPRNLGVTAGMAGASLSWSLGRLNLQPFGEVGLGRVEGRFDGGGYEQVLATGDTVHVPLWKRVQQDGLGFGAGLETQLVLAPRIILGVLAGHWSFSTPPEVVALPSWFIGAGLRFGFER